ncbi:hypothetical protein [Sulfitobacter pacificus]|uniref:hypothetical protein n=1 Tax=Sulfitobacter pacificus TaxID=1499314 RepID=UPI003103774E
MHMIQEPITLSQNLCVNAYKQAQSDGTARKLAGPAPRASNAPSESPIGKTRSKKATKELKVSVLSSLQSQSNAGTVNIRDVAVALDRILKKP